MRTCGRAFSSAIARADDRLTLEKLPGPPSKGLPNRVSRMLSLLNEAPYGVYAVDMSQTILFWNRSAEQILGHTPDEVIGLRCYEVLQSLPENGAAPLCIEGCPAIQCAREGIIPPVVHVAARCASGARKRITVTPLIVQSEQQRVLVHLFHEQKDDAEASSVAKRVLGVLSSETEHSDGPNDFNADPANDEVAPLSAREVEVLRLLAMGLEIEQIAHDLNISEHTVLNHVRNARRKLRARNRLAAVLTAFRLGLI